MIPPRTPEDEPDRLRELYSYEILDSASEQDFDDILDFALEMTGAAMGAIAFVDAERQWFKARRNVAAVETAREISFCGHGILSDDMMIVEDARQDPRFHDNPLVQGDSGIVFYAGMPLVAQTGHRLGMLCVQDTVARTIGERGSTALSKLARWIMDLLELRRAERRSRNLSRALEHREQNTLQFFSSLMRLYSERMSRGWHSEALWVTDVQERMAAYSYMFRRVNELLVLERCSAGAHIVPVVMEMLNETRLRAPASGRKLPLSIEEFTVASESASALVALLYEVVLLVAALSLDNEFDGRVSVCEGSLIVTVETAIDQQSHEKADAEVRIAIIETLCARLSGHARAHRSGGTFSLTCRCAPIGATAG